MTVVEFFWACIALGLCRGLLRLPDLTMGRLMKAMNITEPDPKADTVMAVALVTGAIATLCLWVIGSHLGLWS